MFQLFLLVMIYIAWKCWKVWDQNRDYTPPEVSKNYSGLNYGTSLKDAYNNVVASHENLVEEVEKKMKEMEVDDE